MPRWRSQGVEQADQIIQEEISRIQAGDCR
jgi:hypothetical protein